jgi:hypothetical protein
VSNYIVLRSMSAHVSPDSIEPSAAKRDSMSTCRNNLHRRKHAEIVLR